MIKKIDVAGVQLDDYSAKECVMAVERMISESSFHTVEEVNMDMLMYAATDECVRDVLNQLNCSIIAEEGILDVAGSRGLIKRAVEADDCFYEILKRFERNHKSTFVLAQTDKELQDLQAYLEREFPRLMVEGQMTLESCGGDEDAIVNEINAATVDVILSLLPSPLQEHFLFENKGKMSAVLWYGVGNKKFEKKRCGLWTGIKKFIRIRRLENYINKYEK